MKRATKLWKARKKTIGRSPAWLKTVQIGICLQHDGSPESARLALQAPTIERVA